MPALRNPITWKRCRPSRHAKRVQQEAAGDPVTMSLLLTHVEDQMMSTETVKLMVTELIDLYRKLNG